MSVATAHKKKMFTEIENNSTSITVRQRATRQSSTSDVDKIFGGSGGRETDYGPSITVNGHVHDSAPANNYEWRGATINIGLVQESDIIISLKLEDVLIDSTQKRGLTIFDTAKDVVVDGGTYEVKGTFRSGLAPIGPYICWVGLKRSEK